ncbi:hypothetical protein [Clostridium cellulovorans]|uniref:Uncharacterized protein n=1 Tax=Clostridium cellulovorans (strain ATCC 35296 / DSM 3052 / OCM 3 / 743B) TaxID=573061 RepID=D9SV75_CLOC7|nr:hypothetical protein [Clostridium cellulovorans]ADL53049.1 hypothetical protein Clocel_3370 [Clostridium cellulovorans 743B]
MGRRKQGLQLSRKKRNTPLILGIVVIVLLIITASIIFLIRSSNQKKERTATYTQTLSMEANLVEVEGYYVGEGKLDGVKHYIFQVEKDGEKSSDIDVSDMYAELIYVEENSDNKDKLGKVIAYERTYSDNKKHFYYEIYVTKDKVTDIGELSLEGGEDTEE